VPEKDPLEAKPKVEVATHCVVVPVVCNTIPRVPEALPESNKAPVILASPTTTNFWAGVVVPIPMFVPVSKIKELAVVEGPVAFGRKPEVKLPDNLLLKFKKSDDCNCPVLLMVAKGRLMTSELVVVLMLKMLPAVPVLTF